MKPDLNKILFLLLPVLLSAPINAAYCQDFNPDDQQAEQQDRAQMVQDAMKEEEALAQSAKIDDIRENDNADKFYDEQNKATSNDSYATKIAENDAKEVKQEFDQKMQQRGGYGNRGLGKQNGPYGGMAVGSLDQPTSCMMASSQPQGMPVQGQSTMGEQQNSARILANPIVSIAATPIAAAASQPCPKNGNDIVRCEPDQYKDKQKESQAQKQRSAPQSNECKTIGECVH